MNQYTGVFQQQPKTEVKLYSDIGNIRQRNEDSILHISLDIETQEGKHTEVTIMLLCDGMGGLNAGDWASQKACSIITETIENRKYHDIPSLIKQLEASIYIINNIILNYSKQQQIRIGTTFTLLILHDGIGHLRHLGDSRLYEINLAAPEGEKVRVLSLDQSVVMRKVRQGEISLEEAFTSEDSSILYMCLGVFPSQKLEIFKMDFKTEPEASYLLASDGFWHLTSESEYIALAEGTLQLPELFERIKMRNERDNISAIMCRKIK